MRKAERGQLEYHLLIFVALALVAFGIVMVYSASSARALVAEGDPAFFVKRQAIFAGLGLLLLVVFSRLDFRIWRHLSVPLLASSFVVLVAVLVMGTSVNGARRWISFGLIEFQPSELAKLALALWVAVVLTKRGAPQTVKEFLKPIGLVVGTAGLLILLEPDLGTVVAIVVMVGAMLVAAGTRLRVLAGVSVVVALVAVVAIWIAPYRRERLFSFLDPWADAQDGGFQIVQAMLALGSGGLTGVGVGESVQKIYYLPEASTDMIFAIIGEELGLLGAAAVILAYVLLGYAGFHVALASRDPFGKQLAVGLTALICGQAAVNLSAVMGLAPLTGIPLPLVSYGGSSVLVTLAAVGILLNIAVNHGAQVEPARVPDRRRRNRRARRPVSSRGRDLERSRPPRHLRRAS